MMSFMGWFSNLFNNEAIALAVFEEHESQAPSSNRPEPYEVVRKKITAGEVTRQLYILQELLKSLPVSYETRHRYLENGTRNPNRYGIELQWPHREKLSSLLNLLKNALKDVDVKRADMKTLLRVIDFCNETVPSKLRKLEIQIGSKDWVEEAGILKSLEKDAHLILNEVALLPTSRSILNIDSPTADPTAKDFPNISMYKEQEELYAALESLEADWDKAAKLSLSAEDDYVIERVGNSYLPDALLLFDRFRHRTASTNSGKALSMVKEQVELIHQQVLFVLEQNEEDSFDLMETHTEFLKMKNSRMGSTGDKGLNLRKKDEAK